jgi:hypothetical protein
MPLFRNFNMPEFTEKIPSMPECYSIKENESKTVPESASDCSLSAM